MEAVPGYQAGRGSVHLVSLGSEKRIIAAVSAPRIRVLLAEDHHVVRAAIASLLGKEADLEVVGEISEASAYLSRSASGPGGGGR